MWASAPAGGAAPLLVERVSHALGREHGVVLKAARPAPRSLVADVSVARPSHQTPPQSVPGVANQPAELKA